MRAYFTLFAVPLLAGCINFGGRTGPGSIPADAQGAMYTDLPVQQLARCFADAIGGTLRPEGNRVLVTSPLAGGPTYDVGTNGEGGDYPTEVVVRGRQDAAEEQRAATCFAKSLPA